MWCNLSNCSLLSPVHFQSTQRWIGRSPVSIDGSTYDKCLINLMINKEERGQTRTESRVATEFILHLFMSFRIILLTISRALVLPSHYHHLPIRMVKGHETNSVLSARTTAPRGRVTRVSSDFIYPSVCHWVYMKKKKKKLIRNHRSTTNTAVSSVRQRHNADSIINILHWLIFDIFSKKGTICASIQRRLLSSPIRTIPIGLYHELSFE